MKDIVSSFANVLSGTLGDDKDSFLVFMASNNSPIDNLILDLTCSS